MYNGQVMLQDDFRLDLLIEQTDYGCFCRVRSSPVGSVVAPFDLTVGRRELDDLRASLQSAVVADAFELTILREKLQDWGRRLFDALFQADVLACYRTSKRMADDAGQELRIHLDLSEMPELACLPWEYLYDARRQEFLSLSAGTYFSRYTGLMHRLRPPNSAAPLRALVVIPSPEGRPEIDVQRAWLGILDEVDYLAREKKLVIEWLQKPTLLDLQRRLRHGDYHILHFMGHCVVDSETAEGKLVFEDEMGRGRAVGGEHLGSLLRDHFPLRIVLMTGADRSHGAGDTTTGGGFGLLDVAQNLVKRGMGAVIATPFPMPKAEQIRYMARFYAEIADLTPVDKAVAHARSAIRDERIWWGAPILFNRAPDGNLFADQISELDRLSADAEENIAFRLSALRIRTATPEAMARWSDELAETRIKRRFEKD
jgi:hypothetical protein